MAWLIRHSSLSAIASKDILSMFSRRSFQTVAAVQSRYSALYLEPTFRREELTQPIAEDDPRRFAPIKAAKNEQTASNNYDALMQKYIRHITKEGKKHLAVLIAEKMMENIKLIQLERYNRAKTEEEKENIELDPKVIFLTAIDNCRPLLITQKVKRGGVIYQVPIPVKPNYQTFTAMKWLTESACDKHRDIRMWDKLADEVLAAYRNEGKTIRKKQELHRLCENNRAYAHFRW